MFNNNERTQFRNGGSDGNLAFASDGTYAGGAAVELQVTRDVYLHAVTVDTEGAQQTGIKTLANRKYMEAGEVGWSSGSPGERYRDYPSTFGVTTPRLSAVGMVAALASIMNVPMAGHPLQGLVLLQLRGTSIKQERRNWPGPGTPVWTTWRHVWRHTRPHRTSPFRQTP